MCCWSSICTNHSASTCSPNRRRRVWYLSGDGTSARTTSITTTLTLIDVYRLIARRTTFATRTSIRWREIRESVRFILTGGAETKTSESTSRWERGTISSQQWAASTTRPSIRRLLRRIRPWSIWELVRPQDELIWIELSSSVATSKTLVFDLASYLSKCLK